MQIKIEHQTNATDLTEYKNTYAIFSADDIKNINNNLKIMSDLMERDNFLPDHYVNISESDIPLIKALVEIKLSTLGMVCYYVNPDKLSI